MSTVVRANGLSYGNLKQMNLTRSLDYMMGEAQIVVSQQPQGESFIQITDLIEIILDGFPRLHGYIEKITDDESEGSHEIAYTARDNAADLIDSTIPDNLIFNPGITYFRDLIEQAITGLNIPFINVTDENTPPFTLTSTYPKVGDVGQKVGDYLDGYARLIGAIISTDGQGNIILPMLGQINPTVLVNQINGTNNNILESHLTIDYSNRFNTYKFWSQGAVVFDINSLPSFNGLAQIVTDNQIRPTRTLEMVTEMPMTPNNLLIAANQEANIRRARGFDYKCSVEGFSGNNTPWEIGQLVKVYDQKKGVQGWLMIKELTMSLTMEGEKTDMTLTWPDAYGVTANIVDGNIVSVSRDYIQTNNLPSKGSVIKSQTIAQGSSKGLK